LLLQLNSVAFGVVSDTGNAVLRIGTFRPTQPIYVFTKTIETVFSKRYFDFFSWIFLVIFIFITNKS